MSRRKELSKFGNIELVCELRERGLAVSAFGYDELESFLGMDNVEERKEEFAKIRERIEEVAADAVDGFLEKRYRDVFDELMEKVNEEKK